jgi:hypothetical protein
MSRMEAVDRRKELELELEKLQEIPGGGDEAVRVFRALHPTLLAARAVARDVFQNPSPELVLGVWDRFMRVWEAQPGEKSKKLEQSEASFEEED